MTSSYFDLKLALTMKISQSYYFSFLSNIENRCFFVTFIPYLISQPTCPQNFMICFRFKKNSVPVAFIIFLRQWNAL